MSRLFLFLFVVFSSAYGVLRRHDVKDVQFRHFGLDESFLPVGIVECSNGRGTGTLIDPRTVLTAAHVTGDCKVAYFTLHNLIGTVKKVIRGEVVTHDEYYHHKSFINNAVLENSHDLAMIRLKERVDDVSPVEIYYPPLEGFFFCYGAGFGASGTGLEHEWKDDSEKRGFTNMLEGIYSWPGKSRYLQISFDPPEHPIVTSLEGIGAFGDSGGPVFIDVENKKQLIGVISMLTLDKSYGAKNLLTPLSDYKDWIETNRFTKRAILSGLHDNWDDGRTWKKEEIPENKRFEYYEVALNEPCYLKMEKTHKIDFLKINHEDAYLQILKPLLTSKFEIIQGSLELSCDTPHVELIRVEGPAHLGGDLFVKCHNMLLKRGNHIPLIKAETLRGKFANVYIDPDIEYRIVYTPTSATLLFGNESI
jgi:hypothetical protein